MKNILIIVGFMFCVEYNCCAQNLVGLWQIKTPEVSSGYLEVYQFYSDSTFRFNTNQYDGLRRIISIGGNYSIEKEKIIFTIKYSIEKVGGWLNRSEISTLNDSWTIENGEIKKIMQKAAVKKTAKYEGILKSDDAEYFILDKQKYFKIDNNPNNYQ